jgi:hypothetical protein
MKKYQRIFFLAASIALCADKSQADEKSIPEEVRALAVLCSTGSSVEFRGQIEGGLNKLFEKIIAGSGDLEISKNETDFLNSFDDDKLKIEARRVYNECALGALEIIHNRKINSSFDLSQDIVVTPSSIIEIRNGQKFALRVGDSVLLEGGAVFSLPEAYSYDQSRPVGKLTNEGSGTGSAFELGGTLQVRRSQI